jgi:hypothetical protein
MNAPQPIPAARATRYSGKTFAAFRVAHDTDRTYPMPFAGEPATIDQARDLALTGPKLIAHKDCLLIRETDDASGKSTLHLFAIKKKSTPDYVRDGFTTRAVHRLYAEKICEIDGSALA